MNFRKIISILTLGVLAAMCHAQQTATIVDSDSTVWANGTWSARLMLPSGGIPTVNGVPVAPYTFTGNLSASGVLSVTLTPLTSAVAQSGACYQFIVTPNASSPSGSTCIPITSTTQNLSASLNAVITAPRFPAGTVSYGYADIEIYPTPALGSLYYNTSTSLLGWRQFNLGGWTGSSGSGGAAFTPNAVQYATSTSATRAATASDLASTFNAANATTNLVCEGDSRMAGVPGQDICTYTGQQPNFAGMANITNYAVGGSTCANMVSRYTSGAQTKKPAGAITKSYLMIQDGLNDIVGGLTATQTQVCYQGYLNQAIADGFTPIIQTSMFSSVGQMTPPFQQQFQAFNQWLKTLPYLVIDVDDIFPPSQFNPYYYVGSGTFINVTAATLASNVATFTLNNSGGSIVAGTVLYMNGFSGAGAFVNGLTTGANPNGIVALSANTTSFTAAVTHADATLGTGQAQVLAFNSTHVGPTGNILIAKAVNQRMGLALAGTSNMLPLNTQTNFYGSDSTGTTPFYFFGAVIAGPNPVTGLGNGYFMSNVGTNLGALFFGGDELCLVGRLGTNDLATTCPLDLSAINATSINTSTISTVASAATIAPTTQMFHLTGTTSVATITPPANFTTTVGGCLAMFADAVTPFVTTGNIQSALTTVANTLYQVCWGGSKFYIK